MEVVEVVPNMDLQLLVLVVLVEVVMVVGVLRPCQQQVIHLIPLLDLRDKLLVPIPII